MSTPWSGGPSQGQPSWGGGSYGHDGPVDPYAGQAAPLPVPPGYGQQAGWAPGGRPPAAYPPRAPGTIIAGSVVGYLFAVLLFVSGLVLLFFGTAIASAVDSIDSTVGNSAVVVALAGLGNWVAVVLFVTSGVMVSVGRPSGLIVTYVATGLIVTLALYWILMFPGTGVAFWAFVHVVFSVASGGLIAIPPGNRAWLTRRGYTG